MGTSPSSAQRSKAVASANSARELITRRVCIPETEDAGLIRFAGTMRTDAGPEGRIIKLYRPPEQAHFSPVRPEQTRPGVKYGSLVERINHRSRPSAAGLKPIVDLRIGEALPCLALGDGHPGPRVTPHRQPSSGVGRRHTMAAPAGGPVGAFHGRGAPRPAGLGVGRIRVGGVCGWRIR